VGDSSGPSKDNVYEQAWKDHLGFSLAAALLGTRRASARQGWAGAKVGLFEHPAEACPFVVRVKTIEVLAHQSSCFLAC
ncbi:MAG: hypothetical protein ACHQWV_04480, partial [Nitrospirales bacterium]